MKAFIAENLKREDLKEIIDEANEAVPADKLLNNFDEFYDWFHDQGLIELVVHQEKTIPGLGMMTLALIISSWGAGENSALNRVIH